MARVLARFSSLWRLPVRLGLKTKLGGSVLLLLAIAIVVGLMGRSSTGRMVDEYSGVVRLGTAGVAAAADVESSVAAMSNLDRGIASSLLSGDTVLVTQLAREFDIASKAFETRMNVLSNFVTASDAADLRTLEADSGNWLLGHKKMLAAGAAGRPDQVSDLLLGELVPFAGEMVDAASNIRQHCQETARRQSDAAARNGEKVQRVLSWLLVLAGLLAIAPFVVVLKIIRLVAGLQSSIAKVGEGNLAVRLEAASDDELGRLAGSLNGSLHSLCAALQSVRHESGTLIDSADDLTGISHEIAAISEASELQAAQVSEAAQEIALGISDVADAARTMVSSVGDVLDNTAAAHRMAGETDETVRRASGMTVQLKSVMLDIGGIVDVVQTVAHQTNLLALNASIEAARVGDAGRGFAVVALEIRTLAGETAKAVKQIQTSISSAQTFVADVANYMEVVSRQSACMNDISTDIAQLVEAQSVAAKAIEGNAAKVSLDSQMIAASMTTALESARSASERGHKTLQAAATLRTMARTVGDSIGQFALGEKT